MNVKTLKGIQFKKQIPSVSNLKCMYSPENDAVTKCSVCGGGLCTFCGYKFGKKIYCNNHYREVLNDSND